ncbi:MAG: hypothetical protein R3323_10435 [Wenzhouxiangellaceae bacterium]|nr:hypothetical protein [Wenzhouxiangellaceae bacterium]
MGNAPLGLARAAPVLAVVLAVAVSESAFGQPACTDAPTVSWTPDPAPFGTPLDFEFERLCLTQGLLDVVATLEHDGIRFDLGCFGPLLEIGCVTGSTTIGPLAPGTYTLRMHDALSGDLLATRTLFVGAARDVPALTSTGQGLLAVALLVLAAAALVGRR